MKRTDHDLSFEHSTTFDMGQLIPISAIDVLPGDSLRCNTSALLRVSPQVNPVYHDCEVRVHNWFVPSRILWDGWEDFIVGNTEDSGAVPSVTVEANSILDYMGAEPAVGATVDELPIRAYNMIYNEFYRDQDLDTERAMNDQSLARVRWSKDYFTTARPEPQLGESIDVSFSSGSAPVHVQDIGAGQEDNVRAFDDVSGEYRDLETDTARLKVGAVSNLDHRPLYANLAEADGGININDLRQSIALQKIAEARSFFGDRYVDYLRWYGINPRDGRLSRPEFVGGGRGRINFSEVLSTAESQNTEVGDLYGHGIAGVRSRPYRKMCEEHGWMLTLAFVRPRGVYQTGIPRKFTRLQPTDYWHRELELLPWQDVKTKEIFGSADPDQVFGYVPRYDEYRETQSYVSGSMRGGTEEDWHLARSFETAPTLNSSFVECVPSDRIYSDASMPEIIARFRNDIRGRRLVRGNARISSHAGL